MSLGSVDIVRPPSCAAGRVPAMHRRSRESAWPPSGGLPLGSGHVSPFRAPDLRRGHPLARGRAIRGEAASLGCRRVRAGRWQLRGGAAPRRDVRAVPDRVGRRPRRHGHASSGPWTLISTGSLLSSSWLRRCRPTRPPATGSCASPGWPQPSSTHISCRSMRPGWSTARCSSRCATSPGGTWPRCSAAKRPWIAARTLRVCGQLAEALDAAHARGLIHRDVKPANVLLEDRSEEWAWLSDFGLTRRIGGSAPSSVDGLAGSIDYMAPEAIEGGPVDGRADQYSLACLAYHCLAGAPPFEGATEASVLYSHVHDPGAAPARPGQGWERRPGRGAAACACQACWRQVPGLRIVRGSTTGRETANDGPHSVRQDGWDRDGTAAPIADPRQATRGDRWAARWSRSWRDPST